MSMCFLNGDFLLLAQAKISVLDRAFIFGDAAYEVIPVRHGMPFALTEHLKRLDHSLAALGIDDPYAPGEWRALFAKLIRKNGGGDQSLYVQVSRGPAPRDHLFPASITPTIFMMMQPNGHSNSPTHVNAITAEDIRWSRCDIKSTSLLANVLLRNRADAKNAYEAILLRGGRVTEGTVSNVFIVENRTIKTPVLSPNILPGVTRELVIEVLDDANLTVEETDISESQLRNADEIGLVNSLRNRVTVGSLDGKPIGTRARHPLAPEVYTHFQKYIAWRQAH